ncbi:MAG TPA: penicillin-binding transpeptidase domain-containing protein [Sandaracinaceae bacterium LLY-WYZ-13_1]|nr:penicillin-binding transpeptidase domain-containing protein [Sandaracinaceae bacterium LLY-WYZ-13_1]
MRVVLGSLVLVLAACDAVAPTGGPEAAVPPREPSPDGRAARVLDEELSRTVASPDVRSALAVVLDARTGRALAMQSLEADGAFDPERPAREVRRHGSVVKPLTVAAALDTGCVEPTDRFEGGELVLAGHRVRDWAPHGAMSLGDVMAFSSNVGTTRIFERLGREPLIEALTRAGLGHRISDAARRDDVRAARLAYGASFEATPLEIAAAFGAIANDGVYRRPWRAGEPRPEGERVLSSDAAASTMALLEGAVARDDATGRRARVPGYRVAGKTGTVPFGDDAVYGVFVGVAPADAPRFVVLVGVVAGAEQSGGTVAAPAFARVARRLLRTG